MVVNRYNSNKLPITNTLVDKMTASKRSPRPKQTARENHTVLWDTQVTGLFVRMSPTGSKSWYYNYRTLIKKQSRNFFIGKYPNLLTVKARSEAKRLAGLVASGHDPHEDKRADIKAGTVTEYSELYIKTLPAKKSKEKEIFMHRGYIQPSIGKLRLKDVDPSDIEIMKVKYEDTPAQANHVKVYTHKFFAWCVKNTKKTGLVTNPATGIAQFPSEPRQFHMTDTVIAKVAKFLNQKLESKPIECYFISMLVATGCRPSEIYSRAWTDVDFASSQMFNIPTKTGRKTIQLGPPAMKSLKNLFKLTGETKWLFPSPANIENHRVNFRFFWDELRTNTGLGKKVQMRDMRHHFATRMLENTGDIAVVSALLNHKSIATTAKHYAQVLQTTKLKALETKNKGTQLL